MQYMGATKTETCKRRSPQTVEKPRESARRSKLFRALIVVGGMYGDHGADFSE